MGMNMGQLGLRHALARLRGKQLELARRKTRLQAELEALQVSVLSVDNDAARTAQEIEQLESALATVYADAAGDVGVRQTFPKKHITGWGNLTRTILKVFRDANGGALSATQVSTQLQAELGLSPLEPGAAKGFRRQVGRALQNMHHAGYLQGLHDPTARKEGIWRLKVSSE